MFNNFKKRLSKNFTERKTFASLRKVNLEAQLILSAKNITVHKNNRKKHGFYLGISSFLKSYYHYIKKSILVKGIVAKVSLLPSMQVWNETFSIKTYNKIVKVSQSVLGTRDLDPRHL